MAENFILPFIKSNILNSDIENLNEAGILKVIFKNLLKAEIFREIHLDEDEKLKAVKSFSTKLKLSEENLKILEKKDPGFKKRLKNEAIIREKTEILHRDFYLEKAEKFFKENRSKFNKYIYSLIRNSDRNVIYELYYQVESGESSINELAKKYSIGNENLKKGIIGPVKESNINPKILERLQSTDLDIISEPFQIADTWYIIQKECFIEAEFDKQIKNEICTFLLEEDIDLKYENFTKKLNVNKT